jgi:RNA 2',3'-cyclic 3'-phosphodiesterase
MRLFIAIVPPPEIRDILRRAQLCIGVPDSHRIRWTATENLHMTVKFLGEVPDARIPPLCAALSSAYLGEPFALHLAGMSGMPHGKPHRVIAASMEGDIDAAKRLEESVDHVCHTQGFPLESRPFMPHITIGRTGGRPLHLKAGELDASANERMFRNSTFSVEEIVLMSSTTRPTGAEYATVASFSLGKRRDPWP